MQWHYVRDGLSVGPLSGAELAALEANGSVNAATLVWTDGMGQWEPLGTQRSKLPAPKAPAPATAPLPLATPVAAEPTAADDGVARKACSDCGKLFRDEELFRYKDLHICPNCKPAFLRRLKDGQDLTGQMELAGFWTRFSARFVDGILFQIISFGLNLALLPLLGITNKGFNFIPFVILMTLSATYEIVMIARYGATLGKMAANIEVVQDDGSPMDLQRSVYRFFASMLSTFTCCIGYLIMLGHPRKQTLHDRLVGTLVVKVPR